jgi:hypothetical protein
MVMMAGRIALKRLRVIAYFLSLFELRFGFGNQRVFPSMLIPAASAGVFSSSPSCGRM